MKPPITAALLLAILAVLPPGAHGNDADDSGSSSGSTGTVLVSNSHGGYNVTNPDVRQNKNIGAVLVSNSHGGYNVTMPGARNAKVIPFFGGQGFASMVIAHASDAPVFILVPTVEDVGHGGKIVVYKRIYFATAAEAAAAKAAH